MNLGMKHNLEKQFSTNYSQTFLQKLLTNLMYLSSTMFLKAFVLFEK